ncbi:MAG: translocation/assembly module TamB domain-containing protein [Armatimonadota bacterium]
MRSRSRLLIAIALLILAIAAGFFILRAVRLFYSRLPREIEREVSAYLNRPVQVGSARLTSLHTVILYDARVADGKSFKQGVLLYAPRATVRFDTLTGRIRAVTLYNTHLRLTRNRAGVWNVEDLFRRPPVPPERRFRGLITVRGGTITVIDYTARLPRLPARNILGRIGGTIDFTSGRAVLNLRGESDKIRRIHAQGRIDRVRVDVRNGEAAYLFSYFANIRNFAVTRGIVNGSIVIAPVVTGSGTLRGAEISAPRLREPIRDASANFRFVGSNVALAASGRFAGTPFTATGRTIGFSQLDLTVRSDRVGFTALRTLFPGLPAARSVPGTLTARITGSTTAPRIAVQLSIPRAIVSGLTLTNLRASGVIPRISISARVAGGTIYATGALIPEALNFRVRGENIALAPALSALGYPQIVGTADFSGTLTGNVRAPRFTGTITARNGQFRGTRYDTLSATLVAVPQALILRDLTLRRGGAEVSAVGEIVLARGRAPRFALQARARNIPAQELFRLLGITTPITGTASADITVSGTAPNLAVTGEIALANVTIAGIRIDSARIRTQVIAGRTTITELVAVSDGMRVTGSGFIGPRGELQVNLVGENLNLSMLNPILRPYVTLSGPMTLTGQVTGTLAKPVLRAAIASPAPVVNGVPFSTLDAAIAWDGGLLTVRNGLLLGDGSTYAFPMLTWRPRTREIQAQVSVANGNLAVASQVLANSPLPMPSQPISGRFDAALTLSADRQLLAQGTLSASDVRIGENRLGTVTAEANLLDDTLRASVNVNSPDGQLSLAGTMANGQLDFRGQTDLPLSTLAPFLSLREASGALSAQFALQGPIASPVVTASLTAANVRANGVTLDTVEAPNLVIREGTISGDVRATRGESEITATGELPFTWSGPTIPGDRPMSATIRVNDPNFSLPEATGLVTASSGDFSANIQVGGTPANPALSGNVQLANGRLALKDLENEFTDLTLSASFIGSTLQVESLRGRSTLGGEFTGSGSVVFPNITRPADAVLALSITFDSLRLSPNIPDVMRGALSVTGQLLATETLGSPFVQGQLVVSDARISLPPELVPTTLQPPPLPVNPRLNITLNLAKDVVIERGNLRATVTGPVTVSGSGSSPVIAGTIRLENGRVRYARTLDLLPGGTISFLIRPPAAPVIVLEVTGRTRFAASSPITGRVTRYTVFLDISGPVGALNIEVRSSPPGLSETQALAGAFGLTALTEIAGVPSEVFGNQLGQLLLGVVVPGLFEPFELGPFLVSLEPGVNIPLQLTVSYPATDRVILTFSRSATGVQPTEDFSISYTISPQFAVSVDFSGENGVTDETTYLIEYFNRF